MFVRTESLRSYIRLYPVNTAVLLICLLMFALMTLAGGSTSHEVLVRFGALLTPFPPSELLTVEQGLWDGAWNYFRFVSAIFLHIGFAHLLFNGFSIFVFAPPLERILGHVRYALFFIGTGIAGNLASHLMGTLTFTGFYTVSAGASGAIFGVFGAYLSLIVFRRSLIDKGTYTTVMTLVIMGAIYSFVVPNVNIPAHFAGLAAGFLWMTLLLVRKPR